MSGSRSRPRSSHTCRDCRRRKLRCDQVRPVCSRCATNGITCVYDAAQEFRFVPADVPGSSSSASQPAASPDVIVPLDRLRNLEERLESLTSLVQSLRSTGAPEGASQQLAGMSFARTHPLDDSSHEDNGLFSVQGDGRAFYASKNHWASITQEASEIESLMRSLNSQLSLSEMEDQPWRRGLLTGVLLSTPPVGISSMRASIRRQSSLDAHQLPDKTCCDFLIHTYLANYHPIVPLLHELSFRNEYERYWELRTGAPDVNATPATPLVLAVLWTGSVVCNQSDWDLQCHLYDREEVMLQIYWIATRSLQIANFPHIPTVETLSAYILLQSTCMREEETLGTAAFVGVIVRAAQILGLNREPLAFHASISPITAEVRRRVWWHVFRIDVLVSLSSGLSPLIDRGTWDVQMPSDVRDELVGTEAALDYEIGLRNGVHQPQKVLDINSMVSTASIFIRGKIEETVFARELLNKMFQLRSLTLDDLISTQQDLEDLQKRMLVLAERIPRPANIQEDETTDSELNSWTKLTLWAMGDRYWWYLYSPLLQRTTHPESHELLARITHNCLSFLLKYICLAACPEFQRFYWSWPGNHQPLHAITLLLKELERAPNAPNAQNLRSIIDHAISLCGPDGGITAAHGDQIVPRPLLNGGHEAWNVIRRLRTRIWLKAGLNPESLPTRAQCVRLAQEQLASFRSDLQNNKTPDISCSVFGSQPNEIWSAPDIFMPNSNWQDWDAIFSDAQ